MKDVFQRNYPSLTMLSILLLTILYLLPPSTLLLLVALIILVYIPGFRFSTLLLEDTVNRVGLAMAIGFGLQGLSILFVYGTLPTLGMELKAYLILMTLVYNVTFDLFSFILGKHRMFTISYFIRQHVRELHKKHVKVSLIIFAVAISFRILYQFQNVCSILPDGALYYEAARHLAEDGAFAVNVLNYTGNSPYQLLYGLIPRTMTWFLMAFFFAFGGVSFQIAKMMVVVMGALLIFPVCELARAWFGGKGFAIAGLMMAFHPLLAFYSITLYGPEIISMLFALTAISLLEQARIEGVSNYGFVISTALLGGASMLAWDYSFIVVYLLAYGVSLLYPFSKRGLGRSIIVGSLCIILYLTRALSVTQWTLVFPIYFTIFMLLVAFIFRKKDQVICSFALIVGIMIVMFQLEINRYYMFPQGVIYPTLQAAARIPTSFYFFQNVMEGRMTEIWNIYESTVRQYSLLPVILLACLSPIVYYKGRLKGVIYPISFILVHIAGMIMFFPPKGGLVGCGFSASRFFLPTITLLIILASATLNFLVAALKRGDGTIASWKRGKPTIRVKMKTMKIKMVAIFTVSLLLVALAHSFYYEGYKTNNVRGLQEASLLDRWGIFNGSDWILSNTDPKDVILTSAASSRHWAMYVDWMFVSIEVNLDGALLPTQETDILDVVTLAHQFNAKYVIFDPSIYWYHPRLKPYYYTEIRSEDSKWLIIPFNVTMKEIIENRFTSLKLEYVCESPRVVIYRFLTSNIIAKWYDDTFSDGWIIEVNGTLEVDNGWLRLFTHPFEDDQVYALRRLKEENIVITENTFITFKAINPDDSLVGVYIRFVDGSDFIATYEREGVYALPLSNYKGKKVDVIFLYNILKPEQRGTPFTYSVSYDFVAILEVN